MNTASHPVAPEEIMAFVDGELSAADGRTVSTHMDGCPDCAKLAEQFHRTSQSLARWNVEAVPANLEKSVTVSAGKTASGIEIGQTNIFIRAGFWTWRQWAIAGGGTLAALLLVIAISSPVLHRSPLAETHVLTAFQDSRTDRGYWSAGKSQADGPQISDRQSKVFQGGTGNVPLNSPGVVGDSKGLFHGLGDHARDSFSTDGQPITDQQGQNAPAPMIARTVSLSIVVKDFRVSRSSLDAILARHRGYFGQLNVITPENAARGLQASLRIPVPELTSALGDLKNLGRVENESQYGEEVTQQHTDLVAHLKTSRDTERRFRTILQQRTGNAVDVLQVEQGIARIRGDIERMETEQKALEHRVSFATVDLQLSEEYKAPLNPPATSVSTRIRNGFVAGYHSALETGLGIVLLFAEYAPSLLIWLAILIFPAILVWRRYRRVLSSV